MVCAGIAAYAALFVFAAVIHYVEFQTGRIDLGNMVQAIWNTLHGHFLESTTLQGRQVSRLGAHVDPFLLLFVPLFWISSNPLILPVVQALAVASGALPVFWLARKHLGSSRAGAHFAFAYLLYPATQFNAFTTQSSFHSVVDGRPARALRGVVPRRGPAGRVLGRCPTRCVDERGDPPRGRLSRNLVRRHGEATGCSVSRVFALGLALTLFNFLWVIPHFSPTGVDPFAGRYRAVGGTPDGNRAQALHGSRRRSSMLSRRGHKATYLALLLIAVPRALAP